MFFNRQGASRMRGRLGSLGSMGSFEKVSVLVRGREEFLELRSAGSWNSRSPFTQKLEIS